MFWALLFAYLIILFGGGEGLAKDISKPVKQHVQDEARMKRILAINEAMLKEEAKLAENISKTRKSMAKLNRNRSTSGDELQAVFIAVEQKRTEAREKILDGRFKMKALMTAEEWSKVFADQPEE